MASVVRQRAGFASVIDSPLFVSSNPLIVVLLEHAPLLLSEDSEEIIDIDILDKHRPVFKELETPFLIPTGRRDRMSLDAEFNVSEASHSEMAAVISSADRVIVF